MTQKAALRALVTALILVATISCSSKPRPSEQESIDDFSVDKLTEHQRKVVVLNFWAIWCAPCRTEMPDLETVYQQYRDQGVVVLAVNVSESSADIIAFARRQGLTFPILRDSQQEAMRAYKVRVLPTTVFIDRQGQVRHRQLGTMTESFLRQQVESLLE